MRKETKKLLSLFFSFALFIIVATGCEPDDTGSTEPDETGVYSVCSYTSNLSSSYYSAAKMYYPCETEDGPFAASTLTGGYTNTYSDMEWLAKHVVSHGFVVLGMTPNNNWGTNEQWTQAHEAGYYQILEESSRSGSPIYGLVKTNKIQIMGFSKGGGGTLLASDNLGSQVAATQALAPYMDYSYNISGIASPTICYTGTSDTIASPSNVVKMFYALPSTIDRTLAYFNGVAHTDWMSSSGSYHDRMTTYIVSWMKVYLDGDTSYEDYIDGSQSWFNQFVSYEGTGTGGTEPQPNTEYRIKNRNSGLYVEVVNASTEDGANVQQWENNGHACQVWTLIDMGGGYYKIVNKNSGKYLEVQYALTDDGANVGQWGDTGNYCQQWSLQDAGNGYYLLINRNSGKALDVYEWSTEWGGNLVQWTSSGGANQQFSFE